MSLTKVSYQLINGALINVLDYGAIPNQTGFDNSVAFNAAITAATSENKAVFVPAGAYYVSNSIMMLDKTSIVGEQSNWAYSDSGYNLKSVIIVNATNSFASQQPVIDARTKRQTYIEFLDIDGAGKDVTCLEYGARTDPSTSYNNHEFNHCVFRNSTYGVRANYSGLIKAYGNQFTGQTLIGLYSPFSMSDSTFVNNYFNDIGYSSTSTDNYSQEGVAVWLGQNAGNAFIGGKIEFCRVGFTCIGTSWFRAIGLWMDVNKFAHFNFIGDASGAGINNSITGCTLTGGGFLENTGSAISIRRYTYNMSVAITGGSIKALTDALANNPSDATYGPKLACVKAIDTGTGQIVVSGTDMIAGSKQYAIYLDNGANCVDSSVSNLPNSVSNNSTRNNYLYDSGSVYRGFDFRDCANDAAAATNGINVGAIYRTGNALQVRLV